MPLYVDGPTKETVCTNPEPVTDTVEEITGKKALTFRKWAEDHADDFR